MLEYSRGSFINLGNFELQQSQQNITYYVDTKCTGPSHFKSSFLVTKTCNILNMGVLCG